MWFVYGINLISVLVFIFILVRNIVVCLEVTFDVGNNGLANSGYIIQLVMGKI